VKNVIAQYTKDGLASQRYARKSQAGMGDDVLANNCSVIVGLYRNLYGLQPKYNRLYLEPHLAAELNGTQLNYWLRNQRYRINLKLNDYTISADGLSIHETRPFGFASDRGRLEYFVGSESVPSLAIIAPDNSPFELLIGSWSESVFGERNWTESGGQTGQRAGHVIYHLEPNATYRLICNGKHHTSLRADSNGLVRFDSKLPGRDEQHYELARRH
jgi:hypothetical protein